MVGVGLGYLGAQGAAAGLGAHSLGFVYHAPLPSSRVGIRHEAGLWGGQGAGLLQAVRPENRPSPFKLRAGGQGAEERPLSGGVLRATDTTRSAGLSRQGGTPEGPLWADGSPVFSAVSVATLAAAFASVPVLNSALDLMRYSESFMVITPRVTTLTEVSVGITILMAGIPSFRKMPVFAVSQAAALAAFTGMTNMDDPVPFGILLASFFASGTLWTRRTPTEWAKSLGQDSSTEEQAVTLASAAPTEALQDVEIEDPGDIHLTMWEKKYGLQVTRDKDPRNWSVQDLSAALTEAKLDDCVTALQKAKIDGRVAMTFTDDDEPELKDEMKLSLSQRRRLLMYLDGLREAHSKPDSDN